MSHPGPHKSSRVIKSGFVVAKDKPFLGASPDGIVMCDCCWKGVLEVKCPFKHRSSPLDEAAADPSFCLTRELEFKVSHPFHSQVQMQMYVCEVLYADVAVWTLYDCVAVRVARNDDFIDRLVTKLEQVWCGAVLPELLTRRLESGCDIKKNQMPIPKDNNARLYCICRSSGENEDMAACDMCDEWYNLRCLKLKKLNTAKVWYRPKCRRAKKQKK